MKIQVTQEDIDNGICGDPLRCPVAKALGRNNMRILGIPYSNNTVNNWILRFDMGFKVEPFEFEISE